MTTADRAAADHAAADHVTELVEAVAPVDAGAAAAARERHARLAKPPGSLGVVEQLGARLTAVAGTCPPPVPQHPAVLVAVADHGVHARGVSPWSQTITATMAEVMCEGRAAVNQLAATVGAQVAVLDVGTASPVAAHPRLRRARVRDGTADLSAGPAMTLPEARRALLAGAGMVDELRVAGCDLLVLGDMGIANTTASACLVAAFASLPAADVTGPGAAGPDVVPRKVEVVTAALERHRPDPADPLGTVAAVGGLEHAALAGAALAAAAEGVPVVLDGVTTNAAALVAAGLQPLVTDYLVAGHRSTEPGAAAALKHLGLRPLLELDLRLGEGTGGLLAVPLVVAAARVLCDMATLADLGG